MNDLLDDFTTYERFLMRLDDDYDGEEYEDDATLLHEEDDVILRQCDCANCMECLGLSETDFR
jgi:hypothetical protein